MKKFLFLLIGCPGSGKSTLAKSLVVDHAPICLLSSDAIRAELGTSESDQSVTPQVFSTIHRRVEETLTLNHSVIVDATNICVKDRKRYIASAKKHNATVVGYVFIEPKAVLLERNKKRGLQGGRDVPEFVIDKMLSKFQMPTKEEGFDYIYSNIDGNVSTL